MWPLTEISYLTVGGISAFIGIGTGPFGAEMGILLGFLF